MENRGALRFVAGTLPRQPNQRRQSACTRYSPRAEPCGHGTSSGSLNPTAKPDLPWRAVSPLAQQARRSESHHRDGPSARSTGLSNAEVWSAVRRQRCRVLRAKTPPTTNRVHQKEGCPTRPKGHTSPCMNPSIKKFLESVNRCDFEHRPARKLSCRLRRCYTPSTLVRIRTGVTEIEHAVSRNSPLIVYIQTVTRGRCFAPKNDF